MHEYNLFRIYTFRTSKVKMYLEDAIYKQINDQIKDPFREGKILRGEYYNE